MRKILRAAPRPRAAWRGGRRPGCLGKLGGPTSLLVLAPHRQPHRVHSPCVFACPSQRYRQTQRGGAQGAVAVAVLPANVDTLEDNFGYVVSVHPLLRLQRSRDHCVREAPIVRPHKDLVEQASAKPALDRQLILPEPETQDLYLPVLASTVCQPFGLRGRICETGRFAVKRPEPRPYLLIIGHDSRFRSNVLSPQDPAVFGGSWLCKEEEDTTKREQYVASRCSKMDLPRFRRHLG
jgi:hypothetical protein